MRRLIAPSEPRTMGEPRKPQAPATDLEAQLQQLAVAQGANQGRRHVGKATLLYSSFQEAADVDAETIYRIGLEGACAATAAAAALPLPPAALLPP